MSIQTRPLPGNFLAFWFVITSPLIGLVAGFFFSVAVGPILKGLLATKIDADVGGGGGAHLRKAA